jgi:ribonucleoside-diphosphate reductase alpha chain
VRETKAGREAPHGSAPPPSAKGTKLEGLQYKVFKDRYALKGEDGIPLEEYPEQMWHRVARGIAGVEPTPEKRTEWTGKFYELMRDFKFVPGGRILSGAGTPHQVTYYNCYVVGLGEDPLNPDAPKKPMLDPLPARTAFFSALSQMTDIMSRSGGVGINLSSLPPCGTTIQADERGRHGAVRPTVALSVVHPDIERFLAEKDSHTLAHVDMAVIVPPEFDRALAEDADWVPQWNDWHGESIKARELWARATADEGRHVAILRPGAAMHTVEDSRDAIVEGAAQTALALFHGEAPIVDFSLLRPKGAYIKTVNGTSSGPVAWMYMFDAVARSDDGASPEEKGVIWFGEIASVVTGKTIQQGGSRRGALMLMLDDDHPDVEAFIAAKRIDPETGRPVMIEHANMSLCVSDAFMDAVRADLPWDLKWQGKVVRTVRARDIWDQICEAAWRTAEPGVVFMQRAREQSPMWYRENIRCTNPCGEQSLPAGAVCNLGAINLARYVDDSGQIHEDELAHDAAIAVRFLDDVIDATPYFSELHVKMQREGTRRVGLGTMGLADALIKMRVAYGSDESLELIDRIYRTIRDAAYRETVALAEEKGPCGFFEAEPYLAGEFIQRLSEDIRDGIRQHGVRNGVVLTQAPTGTTSLLAGVSSGVEPVFDFAMKRVDRIGEHIIYHPLYQAWLSAHPGEDKPAYFVGARDLTPEQHVRIQARIQYYTDSSISKTANAPHDHTVADVMRLYDLAYELGCKGVTYYREGSRDAVLTAMTEKSKTENKEVAQVRESQESTMAAAAAAATTPEAAEEAFPAWMLAGRLKRRPQEMAGYTQNLAAPEGKVNITINSDGDGPLEVFVNVGRSGSDVTALAEALGRLISLQLRLPSTMSQQERLRQAADQLRGIGGSRSIGFGKDRISSLPDAVAQAIYRHLDEHPVEDGIEPAIAQEMVALVAEARAHSGGGKGDHGHNGHTPSALAPLRLTGNLCPQCGSVGSYVYEEGCRKCHNCGYSEC